MIIIIKLKLLSIKRQMEVLRGLARANGYMYPVGQIFAVL